jgi:hypothetical protein
MAKSPNGTTKPITPLWNFQYSEKQVKQPGWLWFDLWFGAFVEMNSVKFFNALNSNDIFDVFKGQLTAR